MTGDTPAWEQERDLTCHLEEKVVPGSPQPTGGDDDDLIHLILLDLHHRLLEKQDRGEGVKGQPCPRLGQGIGGHHQWVTSPTEPEEELVVEVSCRQVHLRFAPQLKQLEHYSL